MRKLKITKVLVGFVFVLAITVMGISPKANAWVGGCVAKWSTIYGGAAYAICTSGDSNYKVRVECTNWLGTSLITQNGSTQRAGSGTPSTVAACPFGYSAGNVYWVNA